MVSPGFPFLAVLLPYSRFVASPGFQSSIIDLICLAAYAYVVQPFIFTFSCVSVNTLGGGISAHSAKLACYNTRIGYRGIMRADLYGVQSEYSHNLFLFEPIQESSDF